jgi:hypothetical protein
MTASDAIAREQAANELEPSKLLAAAADEAGLDDYGDESFVESLTQLVRAIVSEARLTDLGLMGTRASIIRCLVNRLRLRDDVKKHPEIVDEDVSDPIVIVGLPRTGTTKLQRMLSSDPGFQRLYLWRLFNPAPMPGWKPGLPDERIEVARSFVQALSQRPEFIAGHPMAAEDPDEDVFLMEMAFEGILPLVQFRVPSFHAWLKDRPRHDFYAFEKLLLQYLQWQDGGRRGRPWALKAQTHLGGLSALVDTFSGQPSSTAIATSQRRWRRRCVRVNPSAASRAARSTSTTSEPTSFGSTPTRWPSTLPSGMNSASDFTLSTSPTETSSATR